MRGEWRQIFILVNDFNSVIGSWHMSFQLKDYGVLVFLKRYEHGINLISITFRTTCFIFYFICTLHSNSKKRKSLLKRNKISVVFFKKKENPLEAKDSAWIARNIIEAK